MSARNIDYSSVRYTQEYFYPRFSNGQMSVSETYVALVNGWLDPTSLAPITIFEHKEHLYCIDTRRLMIAKELQRRKKFDVLERFPLQYVKKGDKNFAKQYDSLVNDRLPAMERNGPDGSTVKLDRKLDHMCCYNLISGNFRDDLDEHIARDHLSMPVSDFKKLNISQCNRCNQKLPITVIKPSNKSNYRFIQNCACPDSKSLVLRTMQKPWTKVTFRELCDEFLDLNASAPDVIISMKSTVKSAYSVEPSDKYTVPSTRPTSFNKPPLKEGQTDGFIKQFCLFSIRLFFVAIVSWLIFIIFSRIK